MDRLSEILLEEDCAEGLWSSVESGEMDDIIPELSRLEMVVFKASYSITGLYIKFRNLRV